MSRGSGGTILVAELEENHPPSVAGFAVFHRVLDEAELRNIATDPAYQRKGFARALLKEGIRRLKEAGARRLFLEVRASNQPALAFYASSGFRVLSRRRDYYKDPFEDAVVMVLDVAP
jgi:ribosomal-protein-alanine N-acetyltransferase